MKGPTVEDVLVRSWRRWAPTGPVVLLGSLLLLVGLAVVAQEAKPAIPADSTYVKSKVCGMCHKEQLKNWSTTLHAKQAPTPDATEPWKFTTGWDPAAKQASENGVACEDCHGRGKAHVSASQDERKVRIINGGKLDDPALKVSICAQCHSRYKPNEGQAPVAFTPGENLLAKVTLLPPEEGQKMEQVNELVGSKHFPKGTVCETCHSAHTDSGQPHQLLKPIIELCTGCHKDKADIAAHTKGKAKPDDTCATCHMPNGSHLFKKPASP